MTGIVGGELELKEHFAYPIATYQDIKRDPMVALLNSLSTLTKEDGAAIQFLMRPAGPEWRGDLLFCDGVDLRDQPLLARKDQLRTLLAGEGPPLRSSEHDVEDGPGFFAAASKMGLEGIVAKRGDRPYRAGRGHDWIKVKCQRRQELVIVGYTPPRGARLGLGALLLAVNGEGGLRYAGKVGTGFSAASIADLTRKLGSRVVPASALDDPPRIKGAIWVAPELVCEVRFTEWTRDGALRHPSFQGLREDKEARTVVREIEQPFEEHAVARVAARRPVRVQGKARGADDATVAGVKISNPGRIVDVASGVTKLELARYHDAVAPHVMAYTKNRPLALVRCPEGTSHKCFFQKHSVNGFSDRIHRTQIEGEEVLTITTATGLVELVQFGVVELHGWGCRLPRWEHPDWIVLDLDPDETLPFPRVVEAALELREELLRLGLTSFVKTTGGKGLHVVVPLRPQAGWDVVKGFSRAIAVAFTRAKPKQYTATLSKSARHGRIFIDYLRNGQGATAILPYSPRARPGMPVAMPITWQQVKTVDPGDFTVRTVPKLLAARKIDPWAELAASRQTLPRELLRALGAERVPPTRE